MHHLLPLQTRTLSSELSSLPGSSIVTLGGTARGFAEMPGHRVEKGDHKPECCQTGGLNSGYIPYIYTILRIPKTSGLHCNCQSETEQPV